MLLHCFKSLRELFRLHFLVETAIALYSRLYELYRVAVALERKLLVQHLELSFDLHYSTFVVHKELLDVIHILIENRKELRFGHIRHEAVALVIQYRNSIKYICTAHLYQFLFLNLLMCGIKRYYIVAYS